MIKEFKINDITKVKITFKKDLCYGGYKLDSFVIYEHDDISTVMTDIKEINKMSNIINYAISVNYKIHKYPKDDNSFED